MKKIEAIVRPEKLSVVKDSLGDAGFYGLNTTQVTGRGGQRGVVHMGRSGQPITVDMLPKIKLEIVVKDSDVEAVIGVIIEAARTGEIGDGKIFIHPIQDTIRVRTGERGDDAV